MRHEAPKDLAQDFLDKIEECREAYSKLSDLEIEMNEGEAKDFENFLEEAGKGLMKTFHAAEDIFSCIEDVEAKTEEEDE